MDTSKADAPAPEIEWDELSPGGEVSATVLMASGFALPEGQRVRERYRVEHVLGAGAMGQVLAVTLAGTSDAQVYALKVVARAVDSAEHAPGGSADVRAEQAREAERQAACFAEILRREATKQEIAQRNGVPAARVFALVQLDDGSIGLRMEVVRGRSLELWLEDARARAQEPTDVLAVVLIVRKLVSQLRRLHEMTEPDSPFGFVHSDIKPGNVFVDDTDPTDLVVTLLDFGVATAGHAMLEDLATRPARRQTFVLDRSGGTIGYAPPRHFSSKATPLSDVYAAVVMLYELVTLEMPWDFGGIAEVAENLDRLEAVMLAGPRPVRAARPNLPEDTAAALDAFFAREFAALNEIAVRASRVLRPHDADADADAETGADPAAEVAGGAPAEDDPAVRKATIEQISRLAREYQSRLDELRERVAPGRDRNGVALSVYPTSATSSSVPPPPPSPAATPLPLPPAVPALDRASTSANDGDRGVGARHRDSAPPSATTTSPPARSREVTEAPHQSRTGWIVAMAGLPLAVAATYLVVRTDPRNGRDEVAPVGQVATVRADTSPGAAFPARAAGLPPSPRLDEPTPHDHDAAPAPSGAGAAGAAADTRVGPLASALAGGGGAEAGTGGVASRAIAPPSANTSERCACISSVRNTQIVAAGGALRRPIVLCTANEPVPRHGDEFAGRGVIPGEVFAAFPRISCRGRADAFELIVQREQTPEGAMSHFRCRQITSRPAAPAAPAREARRGEGAAGSEPPRGSVGGESAGESAPREAGSSAISAHERASGDGAR